MAKKLPWMAFYTSRWMNDPHLQGCCSMADQGALVYLMCLASESAEYGYVTNGGQGLDDDAIRRCLRVTPRAWARSRDVLVEHGRLGWDADRGAYYVPSMIQDAEEHKRRQGWGRMGGNPKLRKPSRKRSEAPQRRFDEKGAESTPETGKARHAPESPAPSTNQGEDPFLGREVPDALNAPEFRAAWDEWSRYRREKGKKLTKTSIARQLAKLNRWGLKAALASLDNSMTHGWTGVFEPDAERKDGKKPRRSRPDPEEVERRRQRALMDYADQAVANIEGGTPEENVRLYAKVEDVFDRKAAVEVRGVAEFRAK